MASPAAEPLQNGISTPPTTANAQNPSPPTASSTLPNTQQTSQPQQGSQQTNGTSAAPAATLAANPSFPSTSLQDTGTARRPRDARLIHLLLANMGVHAYTDRVPLQLLDFAYRYTSGILSDALSYEPPPPTASQSHGTSKKSKGGGAAGAGADDDGLSLNALRTAIAARAAQQFNPTLPKEFMAEVAGERNRVALPRVEREFGLRLPPERYCFTGVGWGIKESWEEEEDVDVGLEDEATEAIGGSSSGVGVGGPVGGNAADTAMGGMGEEEVDEDEFEEAFGGGDAAMADG